MISHSASLAPFDLMNLQLLLAHEAHIERAPLLSTITVIVFNSQSSLIFEYVLKRIIFAVTAISILLSTLELAFDIDHLWTGTELSFLVIGCEWSISSR
jgi:hypothetical protein